MNYAELISESEAELKQLEKRQKLVQFQKRIQFLLLLKSQPAITQAKAGQGVGWQLRQSQKIWQLYRKGGLGAVLHKPKGWGFGKHSSLQIAHLQNYLAEFGGYSLQEISHYLEQSFGVIYSTSGVSALCCRLKIKLKTADLAMRKKDAAKVETYKKKFGQLTQEFADEELEFEDEMRVGRRTELGRKWAPIGVCPLGRQQIGYEYLYLYVALKPYTGELFAMFLPRLDKQYFGIFANARSQSLKQKTLWVVGGASAHGLEQESPLLELQKLPAYAPELNPVERFFEELRRQLKFRIFATLEEAEDCLSKVLQGFYNDVERVKSLTLFPYITYARNNLN